ncbi:MAG TPA: hypothetical protein VN843_06815 [Anaerolineales bacterium]|nr:hypothetical protein [Anaerolineales bacterium]
MFRQDVYERSRGGVLLLLNLILLWTIISNNALAAIDARTYIPNKAFSTIPLVKSEQERIFPDIPLPHYLGALIEQESCIYLTHRLCWDPSSKLETSREIGIGLFQITKAYNKTGGIRFDTLRDLKRKYAKELYELYWETIAQRSDLQIRSGLLLIRDNYKSLYEVKGPINRLKMADSAYNGGLGNINKARRACALASHCDPGIWTDNVEKYLPQSRSALYGSRSAYQINVEHVNTIFTIRLNKYRSLLV